MPNLPSVNANNISKLPSTSSTEDSVELLNLFTHYDEKALPLQRQNKRTLDIEYSWGKYKYTASERGVRNKYFTVYKKLTLTQDVRDGLKTVEEKARELDEWWNNIAREEKLRGGKLSDMTHSYNSNMSKEQFNNALLARRKTTCCQGEEGIKENCVLSV